jgi:hypothetical protein
MSQYGSVGRGGISKDGLAYSTLSLESVGKVMRLIDEFSRRVSGGVDFYDIGSGMGNIAISAGMLPNVIRSVGIEIDRNLHAEALSLEKAVGSDAILYNEDALDADFVVSTERAAVFFAFDLVYPDDLVKKIATAFLDHEGPRLLITTKSREGIGAAFNGSTQKLVEATEDVLCEICDSGFHSREARRLRAALGRERSEAKKTSDRFAAFCDEAFAVTFGENLFLSSEDAILVDSPQYECRVESVKSLYRKQQQLNGDACATPDKILERATMHVFSIF